MVTKDFSNVVKNVALSDLWHKRLAHLSEKKIANSVKEVPRCISQIY